MNVTHTWRKEPGVRIQGSRPLDRFKVQAPGIVRLPTAGYRLFYTAVGPAKPFADCQGYILSAVSEDGLDFRTEPGIRLAPQSALPHMALRLLAPTVTRCVDGRWRMYVEARGSAERPTVICSAISSDLLHWEHEAGIRLQGFNGVGGPRFVRLPDGRGRLYCFAQELDNRHPHGGHRRRQSVVSAVSRDDLHFELEPGYRLRDRQAHDDTAGITAAEVIPPKSDDSHWTMYFSAWQDVPAGTAVPLHPSRDPDATENGLSEDFAAASIATDIAGFRSRIFVARSPDGLRWHRVGCAVEGGGYGVEEPDAVHAEDMSLVQIDENRHRMYYAACNREGHWRIVSAVSEPATHVVSP